MEFYPFLLFCMRTCLVCFCFVHIGNLLCEVKEIHYLSKAAVEKKEKQLVNNIYLLLRYYIEKDAFVHIWIRNFVNTKLLSHRLIVLKKKKPTHFI